MNSCGKCEWWECEHLNSSWGACKHVIPTSAMRRGNGHFIHRTEGKRCPCFTPRPQQKGKTDER